MWTTWKRASGVFMGSVSCRPWRWAFRPLRISPARRTCIEGYSTSVRDMTGAFAELDLRKIVSSVKDLWKCLRMTGVMRELAEGLGRLLQVVIDLFQETSTRISGLWKALAFAKDCMSDATTQVEQAKTLCMTAQDKAEMLIGTTSGVKDRMEDMGELNASSITAFRELSDGDEIRSAIALAQDMDDQVLKCVENVVGMIDRVSEGVKSLPPIITKDIPANAGKRDDDPEVPDIQADISDLEHSRTAIENANLLLAVKEGSRGFSGVSEKVSISKDMLGVLQSFADSCMGAIQSFMGEWDLPSAVDKIKDMFRLVNLGELMKHFAGQIKRLMLAEIALMKTAVEKFSNLDYSDLAGNLKESIGSAVGQAADLVEDLNLKGLQFWKR